MDMNDHWGDKKDKVERTSKGKYNKTKKALSQDDSHWWKCHWMMIHFFLT
jgi:hypothetical protein